MSKKKRSCCFMALLLAMLMLSTQLFTAFAAVPAFNSNQYASCYTLSSSGKLYAYTHSSLSTKTGGYIACSTDENRIIGIEGNAVKISYPVSSGRRTAYFPLSAIFVSNPSDAKQVTAGAKITTYRRSSGSTTYGYISKGDVCYVLGTSNGRTQVVYPVSGGKYKLAFVSTSDANSYLGGSSSTAAITTSALNWSAAMQKYPNGSTWNSSYKDKAWQCHGWACTVADMVTGTDPYTWSRKTSLSSLKPGDIIRFSRPHSIIVTGVSGDTITYADCNWTAKNTVTWNQTINCNKLTSKYGSLSYVMSCPK